MKKNSAVVLSKCQFGTMNKTRTLVIILHKFSRTALSKVFPQSILPKGDIMAPIIRRNIERILHPLLEHNSQK